MNKKNSPSMKYLLQETAIFLVFSYLVFFGSSKYSLINPSILTINAILLTLMLVYFLWKKPALQSRVHLPLFVMMGVMLLTSLTSIDVRRSFSEFILVSAAVCLFFLVSELVQHGWPAKLLIKMVLLVGFIFMGLCWSEFFLWYLQWIGNHPGIWLPSSPFRLSNPNLVAVLVNVWLMMALARLIKTGDTSARFILGFYIFSCIGILYLTSSRGGWLGTAAGLLALFYLFLQNKPGILSSVWQRLKTNKPLMAGLILGGSLLATIVIMLAVRQLAAPDHGTRNEFWTPALNAFLASPLVGKGPFTFISAYLQSNSVPPYLYFDYAHSIYMDLLSGSGILGLLAFGWLIFSVTRHLWKKSKIGSHINWPVFAGALSAFTAFCIHGFVDSVHHSEPISLWNLFIIMGVALSLDHEEKKPHFLTNGWKTALLLLVVGFSWFNIWAILPFQQGVESGNRGYWQAAVDYFQDASNRDPLLATVHQQEGLARSYLLAQGDLSQLTPAIAALEEAVRLDPYWALNQANLGALYQESGDRQAALTAFKKAVDLAPGSAVYQLNYGLAAQETGDLQTAQIAYEKVFALNPEWSEAYIWRNDPFRKGIQSQWEQNHSTGNRNDSISIEDQQWQQAEVLAQNRQFNEAASLGSNILNKKIKVYLFGYDTPANLLYNVYMFRRPAMSIDFVPQLAVIALPDYWGKKSLELVDWLEKAGKDTEAQIWSQKIFSLIPDIDKLTK